MAVKLLFAARGEVDGQGRDSVGEKIFHPLSQRAGLRARGMHHVTLSTTVTNGNLLWMIVEMACKQAQPGYMILYTCH